MQLIEEINKEESDFNQSIKHIKENINRMYLCVEHLVNSNKVDADNDEQEEEINDEQEEEINDEQDDEIEDDLEEVEHDGNIYYVKDKIVYKKVKKGVLGEEVGKVKKNGHVKINHMEI